MTECSTCSIVQYFIDSIWFILNTAKDHPLIFAFSFLFALYGLNIIGSLKQFCGYGSCTGTNQSCGASIGLLSPCTSSATAAKQIFDYSAVNGPHTWKYKGCNQSPINIVDEYVRRAPIREMLIWNHYDDLPEGILIENTGHTVSVRASFAGNVPTISGGDLLASYSFTELCFRWSGIDNDGSEHMINYRKFPMEMQVMHRTGPNSETTSSYDLLFIAYFFEIAAHNPYLDPIVQNLSRIRKARSKIEIPPFPLSYLCFPFRSSFYSYAGSLTEPPCYQGAEWFVFGEPLAISEQQLNEFRQLMSADGQSRILRNSRPVQQMTDKRVVNFNTYNPIEFPHVQMPACPENAEELEEEIN